MKSKVRLKIYGVNINKLFKLLKKNDIEMFDIVRQDHKTIYFTTYCNKQKKLIALLSNMCYNINVEEYYGTKKLINFLSKRLGYVIGSIVFLISIVCSNFFVTNINIYGTTTLSQNNITQFLKQEGVTNGTFIAKLDPENLSMILANQFEEISLVSVIKKGTTLVINIKEKQSLDKTEQNFDNFIASKSGEVLEISVIEGTAKVKVGDSFKQGDVLIAGGFIDIHGNVVNCHAQGKVKAKIQYTAQLNFENVATIFKRTGKSITNSSYSFLGWTFKDKQSIVPFEHYEKQEYSTTLFHNNFLPIKAHYVKFFETAPVKIEQDFQQQKNELLNQAQKQAVSLVPKNEQIINQFEEIVEVENGYQVRYTFETIEYL